MTFALEHVVCNICGADDPRPYCTAPSHYGPERFEVVQCRRCDLVFVSPRIAGKEEEIATRRAVTINPSAGELREAAARSQFTLRKIGRYRKTRTFLDVGCGRGYLVHEAQAAGWDAYGVELNAALAAAANAYWKTDRILSESLLQLQPRFAGFFDVINASQVLEHLTDPRRTITEMTALLRPGGVLSIDVPNVHSWRYRIRGAKEFDPTAHLYHFSKKTLSDLLTRCGLDVLEARTGFSAARVLTRVFNTPERAAGAAYLLYRGPTAGFVLHVVASKR